MTVPDLARVRAQLDHRLGIWQSGIAAIHDPANDVGSAEQREG